MSNPLSNLWFRIRKALGCNAVEPGAMHSVQVPAYVPPILTNQGELFESAPNPITASSARKRSAAAKRRARYKSLDKRMEQITGVGTYWIAPHGRMDVGDMQHYITGRLHHKFGKGNYATRIDRVANRLEVVVHATK